MTAPRPRVEGEADLLPPEVSTAEQAYEQMKAHRDWYAEQYQATFLLLHPECPASPGLPNHCHHDVCDCGAGETLLGLAMVVCNERARLTAEVERLRGVVEGEADALERYGHETIAWNLRDALSLPTPAPEARNDGK